MLRRIVDAKDASILERPAYQLIRRLEGLAAYARTHLAYDRAPLTTRQSLFEKVDHALFDAEGGDAFGRDVVDGLLQGLVGGSFSRDAFQNLELIQGAA